MDTSMTVVKIWNLSLARMGVTRQLTSSTVTDGSNEWKACNLLYAPALHKVLSESNWHFAKRVEALVEASETHPEWSKIYYYPSACLTLRRILAETGVSSPIDPIQYETYQVADLGEDAGYGLRIGCNLANAWVEYTSSECDPRVFDPGFVEALSYAMGAELAMTLSGDINRREALLKVFYAIIDPAKQKVANEQVKNQSMLQASRYRRNR